MDLSINKEIARNSSPLRLNGFSLHEPFLLANNRGQGVRFNMQETRNILYLILIFIVIFFLSSCHSPRTEKQLSAYIADEDHGLNQQKTVNGVDIRVTYRPQDFLVKQELDAAPVKSDSLITALRANYNKQLYFVLSLSKNNKEVLTSVAGDRVVFSEMVNRLAFGIGEYVTLTTSNRDTLQLLDFVYPRMFGMSNSTDILLAFKKEKLNNAEWLKLSIADIGLQTGNISFTFKTRDINKTPNLKFR
jgi:hypothetical protein